MDMDGVLVHEQSAIPGADRFLEAAARAGLPFLVLTNNSMYTRRDLAARLHAIGLQVPEAAIWTSALATADFSPASGPAVQRSRSARPASRPRFTTRATR